MDGISVIVAVVSLALGALSGWLLYKLFAAPAFLPSGARPIGSSATAQGPGAEPKAATGFLNRERVTDEFGVQTFVRALVKRIRDHLDRIAHSESSAVEPTIVVGLYGEWGSGKTHWLRAIEDVFAESLEKEVDLLRSQAASSNPGTSREFTLPVRFNAWQFEREAHLIIPLLKTTLAAVRTLTKELAKFHAPRQQPARPRARGVDKETLMALASGALTAALQLSGQFYLSGIQHLMRAFLSRPAKEEDDTARLRLGPCK